MGGQKHATQSRIDTTGQAHKWKSMDLNFETGALLLLIAAVVAMLTRRLHLPYSVGLVAAGIILAILPFAPKVSLTKDLIFTALSQHWGRTREHQQSTEFDN